MLRASGAPTRCAGTPADSSRAFRGSPSGADCFWALCTRNVGRSERGAWRAAARPAQGLGAVHWIKCIASMNAEYEVRVSQRALCADERWPADLAAPGEMHGPCRDDMRWVKEQ